MGYHTEFRGTLRFKKKLTAGQLLCIKRILGQDCREHPEWSVNNLTYIDLALVADNSGIEWDGSEKTYNMTELVNVVIRQMRNVYPDFGLTGVMTAQGDDIGDYWELYISEDGYAMRREFVITGEVVTCPYCYSVINLTGYRT